MVFPAKQLNSDDNRCVGRSYNDPADDR